MLIDLKWIAVRRKDASNWMPPPDTSVRLYLDVRPSPDHAGLELAQLHEDHIGTLARVVSGIDASHSIVPVAVKIQRDEPLPESKVTREASDAKFLEEFLIHRRLRNNAETLSRSTEWPVARCYDLHHRGQSKASPPQLPPCLFCEKASHALVWRGTPEQTAGQDTACQGCNIPQEQRPRACEPHLVHPFHSKCGAILIFELLEKGSLRDLLEEGGLWSLHKANEGTVSGRDSKATPPEDPTSEQLKRLQVVAQLAQDILSGVYFLHKNKTAHLDLNPENICLYRSPANRLRAKLIDLGLSESKGVNDRVRIDPEDQIWPINEIFAAAECTRVHCKEELRGVVVSARGNGIEWLHLRFEMAGSADYSDPLICPRDHLRFPSETGLAGLLYRVEKVLGNPPEVVEAALLGSDQSPVLVEEMRRWCDLGGAIPKFTEVIKERGAASDIFSFGVVLWAIVNGEPRPSRFKTLLNSARDHAVTCRETIPPRGLVVELQRLGFDRLKPVLAALRQIYGEALSHFAEELLGIALRATLRGGYAGSYAENRSCDGPEVFGSLARDIRAVCRALDTRAMTLKQENHRNARLLELWKIAQRRPLDLWIKNQWHRRVDPASWTPIEQFLEFAVDNSEVVSRERQWLDHLLLEHGNKSIVGDYELATRTIDPAHIPIALLRVVTLFEFLAPLETAEFESAVEGLGLHPGSAALHRLLASWRAFVEDSRGQFDNRSKFKKLISRDWVRVDLCTLWADVKFTYAALENIQKQESRYVCEFERRIANLIEEARSQAERVASLRWINQVLAGFEHYWRVTYPKRTKQWEARFDQHQTAIRRHFHDVTEILGPNKVKQQSGKVRLASIDSLNTERLFKTCKELEKLLPGPAEVALIVLETRMGVVRR